MGVTGEYPTTGLHLLGNERVVKALVHNLESVQLFHNEQTGEEMTCRLISILGKGRRKTIRFYRPALPILNWVHPRALSYYLYAFNNHKFSGDELHKDRMHRSAEAAAMCMRAGIEFRPYMTPNLQHRIILKVIRDTPAYYGSREIKEQDEDDVNKIAYSRLVGAVFTPENCMAVYNTRDTLMKWNGLSEIKAKLMLQDIARMNAKVGTVGCAIMFGHSYGAALKMLEAYERTRRRERMFNGAYDEVYFVPQTEFGIRQMRMLLLPSWREKLLSSMFEDGTRSYDRGSFEYDAFVDGVYYLAAFECDLSRLIRFRSAAVDYAPDSPQRPDYMKDDTKLCVLCFQEQYAFLRAYLPEWITFRILDIEILEEALGIESRGGIL